MGLKVLIVAIGFTFLLPSSVRSEDDATEKTPGRSAAAESVASPAFPGGPANEARLRQLIKETIEPKGVERKALPADMEGSLAWSAPVNGLAARIEYVWAGWTVFVRLKNVSDRTLIVPTGNPVAENAVPLFEVFVQQGSSPWRKATMIGGDCHIPAPSGTEARDPTGRRPRRSPPEPVDRPWVTLQPGEDSVALVAASDERDSGEAKTVKVALRQPDSNVAGRWSGVLETPPRMIELSAEQNEALRAALPFPAYFPALSYDYSGFMNGPEDTSAVECLHGPNRPLIDMLAIYEPAGVRKEFERRMRAERVAPMRLLLASVAAPAGSEDAAMFFLENMQDTDYFNVGNLHYALWIMSWRNSAGSPDGRERQLPEWLAELCLAVLSDNRLVTGMEKTNWAADTSFRVSSCHSDHLIFALGDSKCRKAVPLLIQRLQRGQTDTLNALGEIGDPRAIPPLIETLKRTSKRLKYSREYRFEGDLEAKTFEATAYALRDLKAREAVPILLRFVEYPEMIGCLEDIGDPRALPALREIVAAKGRLVRDGTPVRPELDDERLFAAAVALAHLEGKDEVLRLAAILADPALTRDHRYDVVHRLSMCSDPRAIPALVNVIKTDSDYFIIHMAIFNLADFKYKAVVEGLIECFDVKFKEVDLGKSPRATPETYRNLIARALQRITGQPFGADKSQWLRWWKEEGSKSTELK
jgi:hypothetical protein